MADDPGQLADIVALREIAMMRTGRAERKARAALVIAEHARQAASATADHVVTRHRGMNAALAVRLANIPGRHRAAVLQQVARSAEAAERAKRQLEQAIAKADDHQADALTSTRARLRAKTRLEEAKRQQRKAKRRHADRLDEASAEEATENRKPAS